MAVTRTLIKAESANTSVNPTEAGPRSVKMEKQNNKPILAKRPKTSKGKQKAPIRVAVPSNNVISSTEPKMKRKIEDNTCFEQGKKIKVETGVTPVQTIKAELSYSIGATNTDPTIHNRTIAGESSSTNETIKVKLAPVKTETRTVSPKVKKEPKVKVPKVKKDSKPKIPKRKPAFKLPPEASIYLNDAMRSRVTRAMKQRMFVMSRELSPENDTIEKFEVLGSIGNNYTVTIAPTIKCTCMDYAIRRTHCKHILMVLLKVYRLPFDSIILRSLSTTAAQRIEARTFARVVDPSVLVPREIREKILSISHRNHSEALPIVENTTARRSLDTSDCPVCFEEFEESNIDQIDFCKTCGNNIHKECFQLWARSKGTNVSCVYCRAKWVTEQPAAGPSKKTVRQLDPAHINEGYYANFASELGIARKRDTSTYKINGSYPLRDAEFEDLI